MPQYQAEIEKLNAEIKNLKNQLMLEQLKKENYKASIAKAQSQSYLDISPKDINPIIKEIRNKNLTIKQKAQIAFPELYPSDPSDVFYQWIAPSRLTVKRDKNWYWTMALIVAFIIFFSVLVQQFIWIAVILSFMFTVYVMQSVPAPDTVYRLTKQGIEIGEGDSIEIYSWGQLLDYSYFFKNNTEILYIDTILAVPQRLQILFSQEDRKNINMILEMNLPYKPVPKSQGWFSKLIEGIYIPINDFKALQEKIDKFYDQKYAEIIAELKKEGRIPDNVTVNDLRKAESISNTNLLSEIQKQQEEEAKKILGLR
jgi:hypothetical protein